MMTNEQAIKIIKEDALYNPEVAEIAIKALEAQPCDDAISKQAVIYGLASIAKAKARSDAQKAMMGRTMFFVEQLPPVTPQQKVGKWIPISEKLPEVNQRVLVTSYGRVCYAMMISADGNSGYPVFKLQDSLNEKVVCETTVHSEFTTSRITAWMPLPQHYKAESEDKE